MMLSGVLDVTCFVTLLSLVMCFCWC